MKKKTIRLGVMLVMFASAMVITSCSNVDEKQNNDASTEHHESDEDENMDHYACPMHPEITGDKGDTCSICGMDLEPIDHDH